MKNKKPFQLPKLFLDQLSEWTKGYYIFMITDEGDPVFYMSAESTEKVLALTKYIEHWLKIQNRIVDDVMDAQGLESEDFGGDEDELTN